MIIFRQKTALEEHLKQLKGKGKRISFVPTMGALHQGHLSLIEKAKEMADVCIVSIFVNPTQFNSKEDYDKYPRPVSEDIEKLLATTCDILFLPDENEMYSSATETPATFQFGYLEDILEGAFRPGHFAGVGQIVSRLLAVVKPDFLIIGQKDYQQCMVIGDLLKQMDMKDHVSVVISETKREQDGLAMSSRNTRLSISGRAKSNRIYQCLVSIQSKIDGGNFPLVKKQCEELLIQQGIKPEYIALANAGNLELMENYDDSKKMVALIAAYVDDVRLIDNLLLN